MPAATEVLSDYEEERGKPLPSFNHGTIQADLIIAGSSNHSGEKDSFHEGGRLLALLRVGLRGGALGIRRDRVADSPLSNPNVMARPAPRTQR